MAVGEGFSEDTLKLRAEGGRKGSWREREKGLRLDVDVEIGGVEPRAEGQSSWVSAPGTQRPASTEGASFREEEERSWILSS